MRSLLTLLLIALAFVVSQAQIQEPVPMPRIRTIEAVPVWRESERKDHNGNAVAPWKEVQITTLTFKQVPRLGEKVTVIPLDVSVPLLDLTIVKSKKRNGCDETMREVWWEVKLESLRQKEYFEISNANAARSEEHPFDVAIIYPAVKFARQIRRHELKKTMLPAGTVLDTVKAAIDLTNDGIPDVLILEYCCLHPTKAADECDHTCGKTFQKVGNRWKLVDSTTPC